MTAQTRWILRHPLRYAGLHLRPWLPRAAVTWYPVCDGATWFSLSAPCFQLTATHWHFLFIPWELFNKQCADGDHFWGLVLLNINGRALVSVTHDGARALFL